jgi:hypothetical protein
MNWIKFVIWLCGLYTLYYVVVILWDILKSARPPVETGPDELTFVEHIEPARPETEAISEPHGSAMISSGGVSLQQLFMLAREEAVEFIRPVSF